MVSPNQGQFGSDETEHSTDWDGRFQCRAHLALTGSALSPDTCAGRFIGQCQNQATKSRVPLSDPLLTPLGSTLVFLLRRGASGGRRTCRRGLRLRSSFRRTSGWLRGCEGVRR